MEATTPVEVEAPTVNGVTIMLTRGAILGAPDVQQELVEVPEWGGSVTVRGLTGTQRDSFDRSLLDIEAKSADARVNWVNFRAKLVVRCVVDAEGRRIFKDDDAMALGAKSAVALQRVFRVAQRLSGLGDDEVEELTASLKEVPSGDSGSV